MKLKDIFSPCFLLGHVEPMKILKRNKLHWECSRCQADLGVILPDQGYPVPPIQPLQAKKLKKVRKPKTLKLAADHGKVIGRRFQ